MKNKSKRKTIKKTIELRPTLKDWKNLALPETKITAQIDAQKILKEVRYGTSRCS